MVDASLGGNINTSAEVGVSIALSSESSTIPVTVAKPHFENEMKTNHKLVDVVKAETWTDTKEGETSKMVCTNGNITKTGTVNKVGVSGRDSISNVRKRTLATELNDLCKTAKVTEEARAFDLAILYDAMHEGKQDINLDATKKYKVEHVSSVLQNNPFGCIHTLYNNDTKISDDMGKYCHQKHIETCTAYNMCTLQMHKGYDPNANPSQESVLEKRVQTEAEIAEIIKGISLLKLCSKLKKIHQANRNVSKMNIAECLPAFSIETHCTANMGVVFPSMSKYRNKNTCFSGFSANMETYSINKNSILNVDGNDINSSFSVRKNNENVIGTLKPFAYEVDVSKTYARAENEVEEKESLEMENTPQEINNSNERNALVRECIINKNENSRASDVFVNKNLPRECVIKCEFNTDFCNEQNKETNINSGKELNKCSAKEIIIERSQKMIHISEPCKKNSSEVIQCALNVHEGIIHELSTCEKSQQKIKEDIDLNGTNGIFYSEIRDSGAEKDDCDISINEYFAKPDEKCRVLEIKDSISVIPKWGSERLSQKQESVSEEDVMMPFVTSKNDVKIYDISHMQIGDPDRNVKINISDSSAFRNDTTNTKDICKGNLLKKSNLLFGLSPVKRACATVREETVFTSDTVHEHSDHPMRNINTLETMEISYVINKNDEGKMSNTSTIKNLEANDLVYKSDDVMHVGSTTKDMDATDVVYKSDEDDVMHIGRAVNDMDATDVVYKSDEDDVIHIGSAVNDMDATDVVYKSGDDVMHIGSSVKDMDTTVVVDKNDEDDAMHVGSSAKDMDTTDLVYKSDEDDVMHIGSTAKDMDTTDLVYKSDEDDVMHIGSTVKDMDTSVEVDKNDEDDVMHIGSSAKDMDTTDLVYKSDEDDVMHIGSAVKDMDTTVVVDKNDEDDVMHIGSAVKDMDTTVVVDKNDEDDVMHVGSNTKDMDTSDLVYKSDEDDVMHIGSSVKDMDTTAVVDKNDEDDVMHIGSTMKDMDTTDLAYKSDEDDVMHIGSSVKDMDATDLEYKSDDDNDDGMSVVSSVKYMDIDISNKRNEDNLGDSSNINSMPRSEDCRKERNGQIDVSDLVSLVNNCVSIKDAFNRGLNKDVCDNLSMADEASENSMVSEDVKDIKESDVCDQEHDMLSVMSADAFEDDCSLCSMKEVMSEGSVAELTDIHSYRHVSVCSDSDTDTLRDGSESNDDHTTSYEETSDATSLDETIISDYIEKDVDDSSRCGDNDENEEENDDDDDDDDFDCDYDSYSEYDTSNSERDKDAMSCSACQETLDDVMSFTSNDDDEMNELIIH